MKTQTQAQLEDKLRDALEQAKHWKLREVSLMDQVQLAIIEKGKADDEVNAITDMLDQLKRSENPRSWFFRGNWR